MHVRIKDFKIKKKITAKKKLKKKKGHFNTGLSKAPLQCKEVLNSLKVIIEEPLGGRRAMRIPLVVSLVFLLNQAGMVCPAF